MNLKCVKCAEAKYWVTILLKWYVKRMWYFQGNDVFLFFKTTEWQNNITSSPSTSSTCTCSVRALVCKNYQASCKRKAFWEAYYSVLLLLPSKTRRLRRKDSCPEAESRCLHETMTTCPKNPRKYLCFFVVVLLTLSCMKARENSITMTMQYVSLKDKKFRDYKYTVHMTVNERSYAFLESSFAVSVQGKP
jgi:hypothetical protein